MNIFTILENFLPGGMAGTITGEIEMKLLKRPNINPEIMTDYDCVLGPMDTMGRKWKMAMWPKNGGPIAFFHTLSDLKKWERDVIDLRHSLRGEMTLAEHKMLVILDN